MTEAAVTPIGDYAIIANMRAAGLVNRRGSLDWLCLPRFDAAACFAALLGDPSHGRWLLGPSGPAEMSRRYVPGTLILVTTYTTDSGSVEVTDFMSTHRPRAGWTSFGECAGSPERCGSRMGGWSVSSTDWYGRGSTASLTTVIWAPTRC